MELELRNGLLFTSLKVNYLGQEKVIIDNIKVNDVKLDFGVIDPQGDINGLLGLDILLKLEAQIDLKELTVNLKK